MPTVVLAHTAATLFLVGMIWTIQVVHYPLFAQVGAEGFVAYEAAHSARITWTIAIPWAIQGLTLAVMLLRRPDGIAFWLVLTATALALIPVAATILLSVPAHRVLSQGFEAGAHGELVATNWIRTIAWTAHGGLALWMTASVQPASAG